MGWSGRQALKPTLQGLDDIDGISIRIFDAEIPGAPRDILRRILDFHAHIPDPFVFFVGIGDTKFKAEAATPC